MDSKIDAHSRGVLILLVVLLTGCGQRESSIPDPYGLTAAIGGAPPAERTWREANVEEIASLSEGKGYTLFNPSVIKADDGDFLSVYDRGNYTLKAFSWEGAYLATYGKGLGRGPGQVITLTDAGTRADSLVYLVDPRQRRVSFFNKDGDFVDVENHESPIYRMHEAEGAITYEMPPSPIPGAPFLRIKAPGDTMAIPRPPISSRAPIMSDGSLHTIGHKALIVPFYLPTLLTYSPADTTGTAYPTPDWGRTLPLPGEAGGNPQLLNANPTISGNVLAIRTTNPATDSIAFDLYDADAMAYMHTARFPINLDPYPHGQAVYAYDKDIIATLRDTTMTLYRVSLASR